jgi:hypothetical protein
LVDFVLLQKKLKEIKCDKDYQILRYRDDFKIFVNTPQIGELILKTITEVMIGLGLKMNPSKTKSTNQVIKGSIKEDKVEWLKRKQTASSSLFRCVTTKRKYTLLKNQKTKASLFIFSLFRCVTTKTK